MSIAFRRIIFLSVFLHLAAFSLISLSFKYRIEDPGYANLYFLGKIFTSRDIATIGGINQHKQDNVPVSLPAVPLLPSKSYYRPLLAGSIALTKESNIKAGVDVPAEFPERKSPGMVFYPVLPYDFALYFNDRQVAHVELKYRAQDAINPDYISLKRSISSGNLEADLLTMRYIQRHLFIERLRSNPAAWQTVKIDLSSRQ